MDKDIITNPHGAIRNLISFSRLIMARLSTADMSFKYWLKLSVIAVCGMLSSCNSINVFEKLKSNNQFDEKFDLQNCLNEGPPNFIKESRVVRKPCESLKSCSRRIKGDIQASWQNPSKHRNGLSTKFSLVLDDRGKILDLEIVRSSGDKYFDESAQCALSVSFPFPEILPYLPQTIDGTSNKISIIFDPI
ncbi:MAG: TonB C-terminal domain-containing protein [Acidiferrobacterales bacterium]|nr:TonB C-terminal domain-containing protein [Acidiferrobacterales bacterium]